MLTTHADVINQDLLAFVRGSDVLGSTARNAA
jgi:hypothetical protein